jgi:hypothetical protein
VAPANEVASGGAAAGAAARAGLLAGVLPQPAIRAPAASRHQTAVTRPAEVRAVRPVVLAGLQLLKGLLVLVEMLVLAGLFLLVGTLVLAGLLVLAGWAGGLSAGGAACQIRVNGPPGALSGLAGNCSRRVAGFGRTAFR